jgi:hypothetical protein
MEEFFYSLDKRSPYLQAPYLAVIKDSHKQIIPLRGWLHTQDFSFLSPGFAAAVTPIRT